MVFDFKCVNFDALNTRELYEILRLRAEVFVVEQQCPYLDLDRYDYKAQHVLMFSDAHELIGYTRLFAPDDYYAGFSSIGRVVNAPSVRGMGLGKILMAESIHRIKQLYPNQPIKIGAQTYLLKFYISIGFSSTGDEYLEDGIPHTYMILASN
jgi:ElaA protein